jgi:hypothetical protein
MSKNSWQFADKIPFWRKWLIINERNLEKLKAMDRQCPPPYERMMNVE